MLNLVAPKKITEQASLFYWIALSVTLLATKLILFIIDPNPMFYMGDSGAYIGTALSGYAPPDRSFLYGIVIRYTAVPAHSLTSLLVLQLLGGFISIICMAIALVHYFHINRMFVALVSVLACIEPLQFMMERYVMTETLALTFFSLFVLFLIAYLSRPSSSKILFLQISGIILVSFRISYLPIVQVFTLLAPIMAYFHHRKPTTSDHKRYLVHLILSCILFGSFHAGYKQIMGFLHHQPPSYQYADGFFLLSAFTPLLQATDFPNPQLGEQLTKGLELTSLSMRDAHRWQEDMLTQRLVSETEDKYEANRIALATAHNILLRDPLGVLSLGLRTWTEFFDLDNVRARATWDRGFPLPSDFLEITRKHFALYADDLVSLETLSGTLWRNATYWYLFLAALPLFLLLWFPFRFVRESRILALWIIVCGLLAAATIPVTLSSIRYLHPLGWLAIVILTILIQHTTTSFHGTRQKS